MTRLILMRHAATPANLQRPYTLQGSRPDADLAPTGFTQAQAVAIALAQMPITAVYASPLRRARLTAEALCRPVLIEPALIEVDVGEWAELTWEEIAARWPAESAAFHDAPDRHVYLGGENLTHVRDRVVPALDSIIARHPGEPVLVVSHGVVNRVLLAHWLGLPLSHARRLPQDNTGYNVIDFHEGKARARSINCIAHLPG
jgi:broad specificity phosphatase PhoE